MKGRELRGRGREFIFYPYAGSWTTTCESVMDIAGGGGISNKYFTSAVRIMGTFNPNPGQAPPHLTPSHPSPLCLSNALWRVRHFRAKYKQKVLRVAAAESGNNKYSNDPRWSAMGRNLSAASWPVTSAPFVARNNAEDATRRHLPCSNLPLNHFNFKQIDITLPVPPSCRAAPSPPPSPPLRS